MPGSWCVEEKSPKSHIRKSSWVRKSLKINRWFIACASTKISHDHTSRNHNFLSRNRNFSHYQTSPHWLPHSLTSSQELSRNNFPPKTKQMKTSLEFRKSFSTWNEISDQEIAAKSRTPKGIVNSQLFSLLCFFHEYPLTTEGFPLQASDLYWMLESCELRGSLDVHVSATCWSSSSPLSLRNSVHISTLLPKTSFGFTSEQQLTASPSFVRRHMQFIVFGFESLCKNAEDEKSLVTNKIAIESLLRHIETISTRMIDKSLLSIDITKWILRRVGNFQFSFTTENCFSPIGWSWRKWKRFSVVTSHKRRHRTYLLIALWNHCYIRLCSGIFAAINHPECCGRQWSVRFL